MNIVQLFNEKYKGLIGTIIDVRQTFEVDIDSLNISDDCKSILKRIVIKKRTEDELNYNDFNEAEIDLLLNDFVKTVVKDGLYQMQGMYDLIQNQCELIWKDVPNKFKK